MEESPEPASESAHDRLTAQLRDILDLMAGHDRDDLGHFLDRLGSLQLAEITTAVQALHKVFVQPEHIHVSEAPFYEASGNPPLSETINPVLKAAYERDAPVDARAFAPESLRLTSVRLPLGEMFHTVPASLILDEGLPVSPVLFAHTLKSTVGFVAHEQRAHRKLIETLSDQQLIELLVFVGALNKYDRPQSLTREVTDNQMYRLLLHLTGMTDVEIVGVESLAPDSTGPVRRTRRNMLARLSRYSQLIMEVAADLIENDGSHIVVPGRHNRLMLAPEIVTMLETEVQTVDHLSPHDTIEFALRRYVATSIVINPQNAEAITQDIRVIRLRLAGHSDQSVSDLTQADVARQSAIFRTFSTIEPSDLPRSKEFWRRVKAIMEASKQGTDLASPEHSLAALPPLLHRSPLVRRDRPEQTDEKAAIDRLVKLIDERFRRQVESLITRDKFGEYLQWSMNQDAWIKEMACRDDPESVIPPKGQQLGHEVIARCILCPVRTVCHGTALARERTTKMSDYHYAGYSGEERADILQRAGVARRVLTTDEE